MAVEGELWWRIPRGGGNGERYREVVAAMVNSIGRWWQVQVMAAAETMEGARWQ